MDSAVAPPPPPVIDETPKGQPVPVAPPQPAGNVMDIVAVAKEPVNNEPDQSDEPAKPNSPLPTLLTREEEAANTKTAQAKLPSTKTPGVGSAIAATTIIVISLAILAFLAFTKQT